MSKSTQKKIMAPTLEKGFFERTQMSLITKEKTDKLNNINSKNFQLQSEKSNHNEEEDIYNI